MEDKYMGEKRNFLGETPEERKDRRRLDLIDAALSLVHEGGLANLGVRSVTSKASLSSRYFYENFESIDDLLIAACQSVVHDILRVGLEALYGPEVELKSATGDEILDLFRRSLDAALGMLLDDPRKIAVMMAATAGGPKVRHALQQTLTHVLMSTISADTDASEIGFDDATTIYVAGGVANLAMAYVSGELALSREEIVDRIARLTLSAVDGGAYRSTV